MKTIDKSHYMLAGILLLLSFATMPLRAQDSVVLSAIKNEVDRNKEGLKIENLKTPFYIRYLMLESKTLYASASLGALQSSSEYVQRLGNPVLLVGDYQHNNQNYINPNIHYGWNSYPQRICIEDDPQGIATAIWANLDQKYKDAAEIYEAKQAIIKQQQLQGEEENLMDFEPARSTHITLQRPTLKLDKKYWEDYVKTASALLVNYPEINSSMVEVSVNDRMLFYYDTENTKYAVPAPYYMIRLHLSAMADDGQELSEDLYIEHPSFEQLPNLAEFCRQCEDFVQYFIALKKAPMIDEAYNGPVLFERMALAEALQQHFFRSALIAKRKATISKDMERYDRNAGKGNDLEMMTNKKIISRSLSIQSLSGTDSFRGEPLDGYFPIDAEGIVPARELMLVENGVLRNMLNGRTPTPKNKQTNGHARYNSSGRKTAISPGNVQLSSNDTYSMDELRQKLFDTAKEEDLEYAYIVKRLRGSSPLAVYRVYFDGREELVRGVSLPDFNLRSFKRVLGAADTHYIHNTNTFGSLATYIVPEALLFEELDVTKDNNLTLKTPYIVAQPKAERR